jgi:hypothetical protein
MSSERRTPDLSERQVNGLIRSFLREEWHEDANRVASTVLDELDATPQRRSMWSAWRFQPMPNTVRIALAAAAVVVIAILGYQFLVAPNVGAPNPTPSPSLPSSLEPSDAGAPPAELGVLTAGTYTTSVFQPATTFTVGDGWSYASDTEDQFRLEPATDVAAQIAVSHGPPPVPADNDNNPIPGDWSDLLDVMTYVAERPDLEIIQPPTIWAAGGLAGYWMEIANPGESELVIFHDGQNLYGGAQNRFAVLHMQDGTAVQITIFTFEGSEAYTEAATPIVESFLFDLE